VVAERRVEAGDMATPGAPLFVVEDLSRVKVEAQVAESWAVALVAGDAVEVDVPALGATGLRGAIDEVLPAADPGSRTLTVRVLLDNAERRLRSGLFARIRLPGSAAPVTTVPATAIVRRGPLAGVFVVSQDRVARIRWVALGAERDRTVVVESGLAAGESVVVDPPADLLDGTPVEAR
jgi:RND family efflux transporter MFP subunit